ncbi:putative chaperone [Trypanosoma grayi]|uniref:putative chaperone n=1 Tax=Trypanosoma grayi TaxID=71804 RepID=UPI0004F46C2F|nr:putative chaperone [Trypanosoma grayi]KEG13116.1 putative chaperone [Trypanosoma grayi]
MSSSYGGGATSSSSSSPPSLYAVLGVSPNISHADLVRHFKKLSLELHPDRAAYRGGSNAASEAAVQQRYQRVTEAYEVLSDPERRAAYDTRHSVNFSSRVAALREAVQRSEVTVAQAPKRHCSESARETGLGKGPADSPDSGTDDEDEYIPE